MFDYIPPVVGLPLAAMLWLVLLVIWFKAPIMRNFDNYFAHRRHIRRMRKTTPIAAHIEEPITKDIKSTIARFNARPKTQTTSTR